MLMRHTSGKAMYLSGGGLSGGGLEAGGGLQAKVWSAKALRSKAHGHQDHRRAISKARPCTRGTQPAGHFTYLVEGCPQVG